MSLEPELKQRIENILASDRIVLFMKGSRNFPQCGFSATVTQILNNLVSQYTTVNVLTDPAIREGIKVYSEWPTIPQLYVEGKFVGGCDIVREMFQSGELHSALGVSAPAPTPAGPAPKVQVTEAAKRAILEAKGDEAGTLRLEVSHDFEHALSIDEAKPGDYEIDAGNLTVLIDRDSASRADGVQIDYDAASGGFKLDNPNEAPKVRSLAPDALKALLSRGEPLELIDVRTPQERAIASLPGARLLDEETEQHIAGLDRATPLVFYCHHGVRSRSAAEHYIRQGFSRVYNLAGGIDAWSTSVDPSVPRY